MTILSQICPTFYTHWVSMEPSITEEFVECTSFCGKTVIPIIVYVFEHVVVWVPRRFPQYSWQRERENTPNFVAL